MNIEKNFITGIENLTPRPDIALDVLNIAHNQDCDVSKLAKKIEQDPSLTANMLRMANSSYFGHMKEISSIKDIIVRLGFDTVKLLAITGASAGILSSPQEAYDLEPKDLWHHSLACAILAAIIARNAGLKNTFSIYTAALLHDIGKVVLNKPLLTHCKKGGKHEKFSSFIKVEHFLLGTDHARVGRALLESWGLPESITVPVGLHHEREKGQNTPIDVKIVFLANFLVDSLGIRFTKPELYRFEVREFLEQNWKLPDIPNFSEKTNSIMSEFLQQFSEIAFAAQ
ncbi:MAG: HDOD domain-containing protein [Pseudomonadota bacterium]